MSGQRADQDPSLSDSIAAAIDPVCDRFETALRDGNAPRIEEFLDEVDASYREALLGELIRIEFEFRRRDAENSPLDMVADYCERFPQYAALVGKLCHDDESAANCDSSDQRTADHVQEDEHSNPAKDRIAPARDTLTDYELVREIARGGMGVVYEAWQKSLKRTVAVKMILSGTLVSDEQRQRFRTEAEAAARLDHPNIVPVYEVGDSQGECFYAMGFVDGESLSDRLKRGPLEPRDAAEIVAKVARAVQYAHENGVIHRDLKPANILIGKNGAPRVTDFGLAKQLESDSELTQTGQVFGTPSYMPPEQARGMMDQVGAPADVYSLGAVLYALLTQRPPFASASIGETLKQVLEIEPIAPRQFSPRISKDLQTICLKCLEKDAQRRYDSANALADDLQRYLSGDSIRARRVSPVVRMWRWSKRQPAVAAAIVGAFAGLVVAMTAIGYMLPSYVPQRHIADEQQDKQDSNEKLDEIGEEISKPWAPLKFDDDPKQTFHSPSDASHPESALERSKYDGQGNIIYFGEYEGGLRGLGFTVESASDTMEDQMLTIKSVTPETMADRLGLRSGDRLVEINSTPVEFETDIWTAAGPNFYSIRGDGGILSMRLRSATVIRDGKTLELEAKDRPVDEKE